jgi:type I restriction enzyme S subunit
MKFVPLGDICTIISGGTPDTKNQQYWNGPHAWITPAEMGNLSSPFLGISRRTLTNEGLHESSAQLLPKNSVIMSSRAPIGHLVINEVPMASNQGCKGLIPNSELSYKYLYYFLYANKGYLNSLGSGTTFAEISSTKLKSVKIPLPSLENQYEIVEKLDSAFADIDAVERNLLKRNEQLELLLRGALSVPYKLSTNTSASSAKLGEIASFQGGSQPAKSNFIYKEQKGYIRFIQIRDFGSDKNLTYIPISSKNRICVKSDVLIGRYGASVGKILTGLEGAYNVALMKVMPKIEMVDREYMYFYLLSEHFQTNLMNVSDRSAQNGFSKEDISTFPVNLPSLEEQRTIVAKLSKIRNDVVELTSLQSKTKSELASFQQSILSNAFTQDEVVA